MVLQEQHVSLQTNITTHFLLIEMLLGIIALQEILFLYVIIKNQYYLSTLKLNTMKKKSTSKLTFKRKVISDLRIPKGGKRWYSIPHTDCNCWPPSADPYWSNVGCHS